MWIWKFANSFVWKNMWFWFKWLLLDALNSFDHYIVRLTEIQHFDVVSWRIPRPPRPKIWVPKALSSRLFLKHRCHHSTQFPLAVTFLAIESSSLKFCYRRDESGQALLRLRTENWGFPISNISREMLLQVAPLCRELMPRWRSFRRGLGQLHEVLGQTRLRCLKHPFFKFERSIYSNIFNYFRQNPSYFSYCIIVYVYIHL